jgi:hypothetical protein
MGKYAYLLTYFGYLLAPLSSWGPNFLAKNWYLFKLLLPPLMCVHSFFFSYPEDMPFDWPITNIFGTWNTPQHRCLNVSLPRIEAYFVILSFAIPPPIYKLYP